SSAMRARTELRLPVHLTLRDLAAAGDRLVAPGARIAICENPSVLDAAIERGHQHPLVCVSGHLNRAVRLLLARLAADGARCRYHGDVDRDGLIITAQVLALTGGEPWRMTGADYRDAVSLAARDGVELASFAGAIPDTAWDPILAHTIGRTGLAVEEEVVLPLLLADLAAGLD
ncbi:MAG: DUF2399 domain-containing protein, partial [Sciscionella sp.]